MISCVLQPSARHKSFTVVVFSGLSFLSLSMVELDIL